MRKEVAALNRRQWVIMAAFDELNTIRVTGCGDGKSLRTLLDVLYMHSAGDARKPAHGFPCTKVADHCLTVAENLVQLCLLRQAPAYALQTIDDMLCIALGHIQTALTRYTGSH